MCIYMRVGTPFDIEARRGLPGTLNESNNVGHNYIGHNYLGIAWNIERVQRRRQRLVPSVDTVGRRRTSREKKNRGSPRGHALTPLAWCYHTGLMRSGPGSSVGFFVAHIVMAYTVMAYIVMAYTVVAYTVMAVGLGSGAVFFVAGHALHKCLRACLYT